MASGMASAGGRRGPAGAADVHVGMLSPIEVAEYREFLRPGMWRDDLPRGQGATPVNLLCRELLARGQRLTIFTHDPSVRDEVVLDGERLRICIGPYGGPPGRRPARDFFAAERRYVRGALARERPDIIHAQWTYLYALAAQDVGLPHLITAHDAPLRVLRHERTPYRLAHTLMAWRVLTRARDVVSVSPHVAAHLRRWMGYRGPPRVIPNGIPQRIFDLRATPRPAAGPVTYATLLNTWGGLKNGQAALRAFGLARARRPQDQLVMMGHDHGPGGPAESWARAHGLHVGVRFAGYVDHQAALAFLAAEVDILVHPSLEESFGMPLVEAGALGIPAVAGDRSGAVPWALDGGRAGRLADVRSPEDLAAAMLELAESPSARAGWGERARENAVRRFHVRAVADAYQEQYLRVREGRR